MAWMRILIVCLSVFLAAGRAVAQDDPAIVSAGNRVQELYKAGIFEEMLPALDEYLRAVKARFGDKGEEYITGVTMKAVAFVRLNRYPESEPFLRQWLALAEELYGPNDKRILPAIDTFAAVLETGLAKYSEAEDFIRRSLAIRKAAFGEDSLEVAKKLDDLATLLANTNRKGEAEPLHRQALAIQEKAGSPDAASTMVRIAKIMTETGRGGEVEAIYRRALEMLEKAHGPDSPKLIGALDGLAAYHRGRGQFGEAEALYKRMIAITDAALGADSLASSKGRQNLAVLLSEVGRYAEAEELFKSVIAFEEKAYGPDHPTLANTLSNLGVLAQNQGRFAEGELHLRRAMAILEKKGPGREHGYVSTLGSVGKILADMGKTEEAEPILRRAVQLAEELYGPDDRETAVALNNLASVFSYTYRYADAEPLERRALAIYEEQLGLDHIEVAVTLNNLSKTLSDNEKADEAEALMRRALALFEKILPAGHPQLSTAYSSLGAILDAKGQYAEAETLRRRALQLSEAALGPRHPDIGFDLNNLGMTLLELGRYAEAEEMVRRALAIHEAIYGTDNPDVAFGWSNLAVLRASQNDWPGALREIRRSSEYAIRIIKQTARVSGRSARAMHEGRKGSFYLLTQMAYRTNRDDPALRDEAFQMAQHGLASQAAAALAWSAQRFALRHDRLGDLIREQRDLARRREDVQRWLVRAWSAGNKGASETARKELAQIDPRLGEIGKQLEKEFPDYVAFANPEPISIVRAQALLRPDEVLVQFFSLNKVGPIGNAVYAWALTRDRVKWVELPLPMRKMKDEVAALRCGLDLSSWTDPSRWPERTDAEKKAKRAQAEKRKKCLELTDEAPSPNRMPRFDLARSHELYQALFGSIEDLTRGRKLLIVPAGALTQLPFEVLVTEAPGRASSLADSYRKASWLGVRQAITVLPSASSLAALRKRGGKSRAARPFAGFGNPLLEGEGKDDPRAEEARRRQQCSPRRRPHGGFRSAAPVALAGPSGPFFNGTIANTEALRRQTPLPETAGELCTIARGMGPKSALWLGSRMTEQAIKSLSTKGELRDYRILHFATHGLVAGDLNGAEPSLMFTPPQTASEEDDGLLTASEVAQLNIDADWVVMSACNTAAGEAEDAEALAGLTRAFFYAGARSLLVSHWAVDSDAAVEITTAAFAAMKADPETGQAEALRRAVKALIAKGGAAAHPAVWAPFVLVGEGAR